MNMINTLLAYELEHKFRQDRFKLQMTGSIAIIDMLQELAEYKEKKGQTVFYDQKLSNIETFQRILNQNMELISMNDQLHFEKQILIAENEKIIDESVSKSFEIKKLTDTINGLK